MAKPSKNNKDLEAKIIAKAWKDPAFKKKLLTNPKATLNEMGYTVSEKTTVEVREDSPTRLTFVIPPSPVDLQKLSENELEKVAAACVIQGSCFFSW
jgi:hypothetical protein